jgi:hypothetical protein
MTLVMMLLAAAWLLTMLLVVALCRLAKRGDEALVEAPLQPRTSRPRPRPRGDRALPHRAGSMRR